MTKKDKNKKAITPTLALIRALVSSISIFKASLLQSQPISCVSSPIESLSQLCLNDNGHCSYWDRIRKCKENSRHTLALCKKSCSVCISNPVSSPTFIRLSSDNNEYCYY